jgi:serine/threonine-protein kinase
MCARSRTGAAPALDIELPRRYEALRPVSTGGMGSVWAAQDSVLGRNVAIKVLAQCYADDPRAVLRFMREARAAARLSGHPNVVTVFDVGEADGRPYLVMEHLSGGSVADALRVGAVSRADALRWITEAASALDHAHSLGILHRDIKPANMLLSRDRTLHLADFGIARIAAEHPITTAGELLGTAAYISPEQARGRPATAASDRYALAVAAYELLVGERPFPAEHFAAQARAHIEEPPPRASDHDDALPPSVDPILTRGLAKRPEDRWPSAGAFAAALREALPQQRRRAAAPPTLVLAGRPPSRTLSPRWRAIAALALPALVAGALVGSEAGGSSSQHAALSLDHPRTARVSHHTTPARHHPKPATHTASTPTVPATPTTTTTTTASTTAIASVPPSAATLESRGHGLLTDGQYGAAIPVLRQALAAASPSSLTYAYALFDLGRSLRLAGDPSAAVPVLEARLRIPNQTDIVRHELALALQAVQAGHGPAAGDAGIGPGKNKGRDKHGGGGD